MRERERKRKDNAKKMNNAKHAERERGREVMKSTEVGGAVAS